MLPATRWSLLLLLFPAAVCAESAPKAPDLMADPRLSRTIGLTEEHVYLGELLERISKSTSTRLTVDASRGPVDGIDLVVSVRNLPAHRLMNSLVPLLSHQNDRWAWHSVAGAEHSYTLRHDRSPDAASARAQQQMLSQWSADVRKYHAVAKMPGNQRAAESARRPSLFPNGATQKALPDIIAGLSNAELESALSGSRVTIDPNRLTSVGRDALTLGIRSGSTLQGDPRNLPATLYVGWNPNSMGPVLWLQNGNGASTNVVGGLLWDVDWFREKGDGWRWRGDPAVEEQRRSILSQSSAGGKSLATQSLGAWITQTADSQHFNVLADLVYPRTDQKIKGVWIGRTVEQTALAFVVNGQLTLRKDGDTYLLRDISAICNPRRHLVPWPKIRQIRQSVKSNEGFLDIQNLEVLSQLNRYQRDGLSSEFPDADQDDLENWKPAFRFLSLLTPEQRTRVQSGQELAFRDAGVNARTILTSCEDQKASLGLSALRSYPRETSVSLRIEESPRTPPTRDLIWEIRMEGRTLHRATLKLTNQIKTQQADERAR